MSIYTAIHINDTLAEQRMTFFPGGIWLAEQCMTFFIPSGIWFGF
jgi:hypothetical protein